MSGPQPYPPASPAGQPVYGAVPGAPVLPPPAPPGSGFPPPPGPASRPTSAWLVPTLTGVGGFVLGLAVAGGIALVHAQLTSASDSSELRDAVKACHLESATGITLGDDDQSLTFDGKGEKDLSGASIEEIACLLTEVNVPSAVSSHIDQTTSLDGRQTETWGHVTLSWTYHPDRGLDGVFTVTD